MATKKGADPFDDDDSEESPPAKAEKEPVDEPGEELEISETEPEEDEPKLSRAEKRRNRYREAEERALSAERGRDEAMRIAHLAQLRAEQAAMGGGQGQGGSSQGTSEDPHQSAIDGVHRELDLLNKEYAYLSDQEKAEKTDEYVKRARSLDEKRIGLIQRRENERSGVRPHNPNEHINQRIRTEYPDVTGHTQAVAYAEAYAKMRVAQGRTMDWDLVHEAMTDARRQFGMAKPPAPTRETQSKFVAGPRGTAGAGTASQSTIKMTKHQMGMAEAQYPNDAPKVAYQKWANKAGRKLRDKGVI